MQKTESPTIETEFEIVPADSGLELTAKNGIEIAFTDIFAKARKWKDQAAAITDPVLARTARLELKKIRVEGEKKHKELKEDTLRYGRAVDGAKNILLELIAPLEKQLDDIEKKAEREEQARIEALEASRIQQLVALELSPMPNNLGLLSDEHWELTLQNATDALAARKERERKAEEERIAKEKAEAEERARIIAENARLKKEAEEREAAAKIEREAAEKARLEAEAKAKAEREAIEAKAKKEREELEAKARAEQAKRDEELRKEREAAAAKQAAIEAREKLALAAKEKADAEAKKLRDAEIKRQQDEAAAKAKSARAPDKEKLIALAAQVRALRLPEVKSDEAKAALVTITEKVEAFATWIEKQTITL